MAEIVTLQTRSALSLRELARLAGARPRWVAELVEMGVVDVKGGDPARWRFDEHALARTLRARRLAVDLGLDPTGIAVAMDLSDALRRARRELVQLRHLRRAVALAGETRRELDPRR